MSRQQRTQMIASIAMLIALEVILSRFGSISTPLVKIGFGFLPHAILAMMYGPLWGMAAGAAADFIGAQLFPIGPYFYGFTISAALSGLVFGLCLHRRDIKAWHILTAVSLNTLGVSLLLTTYWVHIISKNPYTLLLGTRLIQSAILLPVQFVCIRALQRPVLQNFKQVFKNKAAQPSRG